MKKYICFLLGLFLFNSIEYQTLEELKATKIEKETSKIQVIHSLGVSYALTR